jgi:hypothetical protein
MKNPKRVQQAILMPNREAVNAAQVSLLLNITQSLVGCLRQPETEMGKEQSPEIDGGARLAIETTIAKTCNRIDNILDEATRWTFENQQAMEKQLSSMYEQNTALLRAQTRLAEEAVKPHARYRPKLYRFNGVWVAILGDIDDIDSAICGLGDTPQEALIAFDGFFTGQVPEHLASWLQAVEAANRAGVEPPAYPTYKSNNEKSKLDGKTDSPSEPTQGPGEDSQGNSPDYGPDGDGNQPPNRPDGTGGSHAI